jgi:hypothetical protein
VPPDLLLPLPRDPGGAYALPDAKAVLIEARTGRIASIPADAFLR